jgi:hypothetical protein
VYSGERGSSPPSFAPPSTSALRYAALMRIPAFGGSGEDLARAEFVVSSVNARRRSGGRAEQLQVL